MTTSDEPAPEAQQESRNPLSKLKHSLAEKLHIGSNGTDTTPPEEGNSGKAHARTVERREEKREVEKRIQTEQQELEARRQKEAEEAAEIESEETRSRYGELEHPSELVPLDEMAGMTPGRDVTFKARIHTQRKVSPALDFILFRNALHTIQGVLHRDDVISDHMIKWINRLPPESIVQVVGRLQGPKEPVKSATISNLEVNVQSIHLIASAHNLPFDLYHTEQSTHNRLAHRIVDLRHPYNHAVFRIRAKIMHVWREVLEEKGFLEISTPKLQPAATETGAEVFKVGYFGRTAFLAQSPQLAKQMAISADLKRVFEIGPVFRAENSNTNRHLTEYTGLDMEMAFQQTYHEVLRILCEFFKRVFAAILDMKTELGQVREHWPSEDIVWLEETPVIPFADGIQMLRDDGRDVEMEDLSTRDEIRLGELVKEKYKTDFYVLDKFPKSARPFYTMLDPNDQTFTNSFDMFVRGQEVCTGGQRIHQADKLRASMREAGMAETGMEEYLDGFDYGMPPHAGAGLGLERIVSLLLNLGNVRFASLFHRDPKSLPVKPAALPHPEASTVEPHEHPPALEHLIANYGDATNTSWLDDRFEIWRSKADCGAIGYVRQKKFVMITGNPLCDEKQYPSMIDDFLKFVKTELKLKPIWMLVNERVEEILGKTHRWRTLTCTEEQRLDSEQAKPADGQDKRRVEREGIDVDEITPDKEFIEKVDKRIEEWKASRQGKQVHLTEVAPWRDQEHRRYFTATTKEGRVECMVVLAQLAPKYGWQIKWALDFPESTNGAIEVTLDQAISSVSGPMTFGAGVSEKLVAEQHIHGARAKFLSRTYAAITTSLRLGNKASFREKFGVTGDAVYICYPKGALKATDVDSVLSFFED